MSGVGTCPRCGQREELSANGRRGTVDFFSEPLCVGCRAALGSTPVDRLHLVVGWLAVDVETLVAFADALDDERVQR